MKHTFTVPFHTRELVGDYMGKEPSQLLCMHGAGLSGRYLFDPLRELLLDRGISSTAFDFIGHGETGGELKGSSLDERLEQASRVVESRTFSQPFAVIGNSMSGTTAIELTERFSVSHLVLGVPAVYAADAHRLQFNQGFTERIREIDSWHASHAFGLLKAFRGKTLLIQAEQDSVIPAALIDRLVAANDRVERIVIAGAPHKIYNFLAEHPHEQQRVFTRIANFLGQ